MGEHGLEGVDELGVRHPGRSEGTVECGSASYRRLLAFQGGSSAATLHDPLRIFNGFCEPNDPKDATILIVFPSRPLRTLRFSLCARPAHLCQSNAQESQPAPHP